MKVKQGEEKRCTPETVPGLVLANSQRQPDALAYRFLAGDGTCDSLTYRALDLGARAIAALLQQLELRGKPVLILLPPGLDYIASLFGCLYAGAIAVPAYPPDTHVKEALPRLVGIARDSGATHALTTDALRQFTTDNRDEVAALGLGDVHFLVPRRDDEAWADAWREPEVTGSSLSLLQYTSGSTARPKGVMISNDNIMSNLRSISRHARFGRDSIGVSWLPPYHDMGLIGSILSPMYAGFPMHMMAPMTFLRRPLCWLETISETRATASASPSFGFEHCLRRISTAERDTLDLRSWRMALNGAEPIRADVIQRFAEYFAPCGFDKRALLPSYGLAEATLMVTGIALDEPPIVRGFESESIETGEPRLAGPDASRITQVVDCGHTVDDIDIAIVDPTTQQRLPTSRIGEIWITGPSVAQGYWRHPASTTHTFRSEIDGEEGRFYLRSGDLGFMLGDRLHVAGRIKDTIVIQGRNYYPHDIERTAEDTCAELRAGNGAAFAIHAEGSERMVLAYELSSRQPGDTDAILAALRSSIAKVHGVSPHAIVLLKRSTVAKTTSGKIQRHACKRDFLGFQLTVVAASVIKDGEAAVTATRHAPDVADVAAAVTRVLTTMTGATEVAGKTFAELGLDYPRALTALRILERQLGVDVPAGDLLVHPTVPALLSLFTDNVATSPTAAAAPSGPVPIDSARIRTWLTSRIADRLGLAATTIDIGVPFSDLGLDSKNAIAIIDELGNWLGRPLTPGVVFDHPTIASITDYLGTAAGPAAVPSAGHGQAGEPIAIVGIGCRFPGAPDTESFWQLLLDGRHAIIEVPQDRWDADVVSAPRYGGFIDQVSEFDPYFFGISAREATRMDPQQRLLLEVAWHALEDAGIAPDSIAGTATGVFVGVSSHDYAELQAAHLDSADIHAATGNAHSVAANRLSYLLDVHGPSLALDTACSSSLAAVHLACQSLRLGECPTALAGGVNLMITPGLSVTFARSKMLSADGLCRVFDDAASGYVRGEGAGMVCLKPLSSALADGDRIYAVIAGSAIGHGGRSNGLTAPKSSAQRAVIIQALAQARLRGDQISYVEAHGTGTPLGDPIEFEGLRAVYGTDRPADQPCLVGSVKGNIGHLEAAAGIAGLIKTALILRHGKVPAQLHLETPNRRMAWDSSGIDVLTQVRDLPVADCARAGVSSFGFAGLNAHLILETAPAQARQAAPSRRSMHALCLSGHTPTALATLAQRYRLHIVANPELSLRDLCHSANTGRAHLRHRAVVVGGSAGELDNALAKLSEDRASAEVIRGSASGRAAPTVAFLFSGQGTQYLGMGKELYDAHPGFAQSLDDAGRVLEPMLGIPLPDLLFQDDGTGRLQCTRYSQPALVALEYALAGLWLSLGIRPAAVLGHSIGAYVAACVAGVMSMEDALTLAAARGRYMAEQPGDGAMVSCTGDASEIQAIAAGYRPIALAAVNAPRHLVYSGPAGDIRALGTALATREVKVRPLAVSHAFHSPMMAGAAAPLRHAACSIHFAKPEIPWVFDATGQLVETITADDWVTHMLGTVRFADGFARLRELGCDAFVEIGPDTALLSIARTMAPTEGPDVPHWLPSLRRQAGDWQIMLRSLGRLHCAGATVNWAALDHPQQPVRTPVPHAVFERRPYWLPAFHQEVSAVEQRQNNGHPHGQREFQPRHDLTLFTSPSPAHAAPHGNGSNGVSRADTSTAGVPAFVLGHIARISGFPVGQIPLNAHLGVDLGFDSLMATELERHIASRFPMHIERFHQMVPDDPTVEELIALLDPNHTPGPGTRACAPEPGAELPRDTMPQVKAEGPFDEWTESGTVPAMRQFFSSIGGNPYGRTHDGYNSGVAEVGGQQTVNFSAFNYLALSNHRRVREAAKAAIDRYGTSSSATPLLCGETPLHRELEAKIASFVGTDAAIVFAGGHATNVATVGHLFGPEDLIIHDEWIHDSTLRGAMLSGGRRRPFPHNDWASLDKLLSVIRGQYRRAVVVIEGAYSQDGDIPELPEFIEIKKRHGAMLMIDEAHSIGVLGRTGRGIGEHFGVARRDVDLWMGTLSKALGSLGGYIAAEQPIIDYLKATTPLYIFSTGISPANAAAALEAVQVIQDEPARVARLQELAEFFRAAARGRGIDTGVSRGSAIIPVIVGGWERAIAVSNEMIARAINVMPIGYPAVPPDKCRLRFFVNVDHTEADLERTLDLLAHVMEATASARSPWHEGTSE